MINNRRLAVLALTCLLVAVGCVPNLPTGTGSTGGTGGKKDSKKASPSPTASAPASTSPSASPSTSTTVQSPSPSPSASVSPTGLTNGFYAAQVLGLDGKPAANVLIKSFVIATGGGNVIATGGGNVIATGGGNFVSTNSGGVISTGGGNYRVLQAADVKTDANGKFLIKPLTDGNKLTVEAVAEANVKALQLDIGAETREFTMKLAKTGSISGKVTAPEAPTVTDFEGCDVFIPGTSYTAKTDAAGNFTLSNVPVGKFSVVAKHDTLGRANANEILVESEKTTTVASLPLAIKAPQVSKVEPAMAGADKEVTITGANFGSTAGKTFQVTFGGIVASNPVRVDENTIKVKVPNVPSNGKGEVIVTVGGLPSAAFGFKVLNMMSIEGDLTEVLKGTTRQLTAKAFDTTGTEVVSPPVTWSVIGTAATIDQTGKLTAVAPGKVTVTITSGAREWKEDINVVTELYQVSTIAGSDAGYMDAVGAAAKFNTPSDIACDPAGNVYVLDRENLAIRRIAAGNNVLTYVPKSTLETKIPASGNLAGMVANGSSDLFILDNGAKIMYKVDPQGNLSTFVGGGVGTGSTGEPIDYQVNMSTMAMGTNQAPIFVLSSSPFSLRMFNPGAVEEIFSEGIQWPASLVSNFQTPTALAFDLGQNLYATFSTGNGSKLLRVTPLDAVSEVAGGAATPVDGVGALAGFGQIVDMAIDNQANIYLLENAQVEGFMRSRIRKVTSAGVVKTLVGGPEGSADGNGLKASFKNATAIAIGPDGSLYVADAGNHRIRKVVTLKAD